MRIKIMSPFITRDYTTQSLSVTFRPLIHCLGEHFTKHNGLHPVLTTL